MSALHIPVSSGPVPTEAIVVDAEEGSVDVDVRAVTDESNRYFSLTTGEARAFACALLHFAGEIEARRSW